MIRAVCVCQFIAVATVLIASPTFGKGSPTVDPGQVGLSAQRLKRVDTAMQDYVDQGKVAGLNVLIARRGKVAYQKSFGMMDVQSAKSMNESTIFRIASMTKAITSVAVMMLAEEGHFLINDPIAKYIPPFKSPKVLIPSMGTGAVPPYKLEPAKTDITIRHLLSHTSGLTYRFLGRKHVSELYKEAMISDGLVQTDGVIGDMVDRLAALPLYSQPGKNWEYGLSTDVLGRLVEVVSGMPLDQFFKERIFLPLGMDDTFFFVPKDKVDRLAIVYQPKKGGGIARTPDTRIDLGNLVYSQTYPFDGPRTHFSGGGGLSSTMGDYLRFLQMLLNGGELDGVRLLSPTTIKMMIRNHIGDLDVAFPGRAPFAGYKFGLGFLVHTDPGASGAFGSVGDFSWGGFFYTRFWVDPKQQVVGLMMAQVFPNRHLDIVEKLRVLTYQAITDD